MKIRKYIIYLKILYNKWRIFIRKYKKNFLAILFTVLTFYTSNVYAIDPNEESYNQI